MGLIMFAFIDPVLALARRLPVWIWILIAALAWGGFQRHQVQVKAAALLALEQKDAREKLEASNRVLAENARQLATQKGIVDEALPKIAKVEQAAASSRASVLSLQRQLTGMRASADAHASDAARAGETIARLAQALGECAERYTTVAEAADRAILAGQVCQRSYESLTPVK